MANTTTAALKDLSRVELMEKAKDMGLKGFQKLRKDDMIALIMEHASDTDEAPAEVVEAEVEESQVEVEQVAAEYGPVDLVGHDWGAIIIQRVAMMRPDLVRSWVLSNAVIDPDYRGHRVARIWNTPLLGEMFMAISGPKALAKSLIDQGVPADVRESAIVLGLPAAARLRLFELPLAMPSILAGIWLSASRSTARAIRLAVVTSQ